MNTATRSTAEPATANALGRTLRAAARRIRGGGAAALALAAAGAIALAPAAGRADNIADAMIGAYNTSGLLEQNRALLRAADEDVAIAVSTLRPVIDWTVRMRRTINDVRGLPVVVESDNSGLFTGVELSWLFFDNGSSQLARQAAQETVLATRQLLVSVEQQILFRAVAAYLNVLLRSENVRLGQNNVRVLSEELRATQDRFDVGEVTRTDVALAESRLAAARANLSDARGELAKAQAEYQNAVGNPPGQLAGMPTLPPRPASVAAALELARRNNPAILEAQHKVAAAELTVLSQQKALGPTGRLNAEVGLEDDLGSQAYTSSSNIALTFNQNIYSGGRVAAQVRRAMAARDATRASLLTVERDVRQDVDDAYARFQVAEASLAASTERVRAAQVAFDGIREEATLGARTTLDVLTAEQELLNANIAEISARVERALAAYELLLVQGLLTAEHLGLAVQIYDPTLYYNLVKDAPAQVSKQSRDLDRVLKALGRN